MTGERGHSVFYRDPGELSGGCILECVACLDGAQRIERLDADHVLDLLNVCAAALQAARGGAILAADAPHGDAVWYVQRPCGGCCPVLERISTFDGERFVEPLSVRRIAWLAFQCTTALARYHDLAARTSEGAA